MARLFGVQQHPCTPPPPPASLQGDVATGSGSTGAAGSTALEELSAASAQGAPDEHDAPPKLGYADWATPAPYLLLS